MEWSARVSKCEKIGTRISMEMSTVELSADSEDEVREILAEEMPGWSVDKIRCTDSPKVVCCVCGEPCSVYSPVCAKCSLDILPPTGRRTPEVE